MLAADIYVVLNLMFNFALGKMKVRHVAAEKIRNRVFCRNFESLQVFEFEELWANKYCVREGSLSP